MNVASERGFAWRRVEGIADSPCSRAIESPARHMLDGRVLVLRCLAHEKAKRLRLPIPVELTSTQGYADIPMRGGTAWICAISCCERVCYAPS